MTFFKIFAFVVFFAAVNAAPNEPVEKEQTLQSIGKTCRTKIPVTDEEYQELMDKKLPTTKDAKCLLACIYKTAGILGEDGLISEEGSLACAANKYKDDPAKKELLLEVIKTCFKVNSAVASDGAAGCERAALNLECLLSENSAIVTGFD